MANTIKLKRASGSDPGASDLAVGEIAIRTSNCKLFSKNDGGSAIGVVAVIDSFSINSSLKISWKYITWISFGDIESRKKAYNSLGKYFDETSKQLFTPKLSEIGRNKWGSYVLGNSNLYFDDFMSAAAGTNVKYSVHNLAMSPNPKNFSIQQKKIWLPFFKNLVKKNQTKQKSWGVARRINPRGQKHEWNVMTVDGFESLDDVFESINSDIPGISKLDLNPINNSAPDGWVEQIIWEIIVRVDSEGEIIE